MNIKFSIILSFLIVSFTSSFAVADTVKVDSVYCWGPISDVCGYVENYLGETVNISEILLSPSLFFGEGNSNFIISSCEITSNSQTNYNLYCLGYSVANPSGDVGLGNLYHVSYSEFTESTPFEEAMDSAIDFITSDLSLISVRTIGLLALILSAFVAFRLFKRMVMGAV